MDFMMYYLDLILKGQNLQSNKLNIITMIMFNKLISDETLSADLAFIK